MKEKFFHQLLSMFGVTPEYPETLIPSVEDTARILKINPEIYKRFENAYQTSDAIGIPGYSVNAKQAAREKEGVDTSAPDLSSLMNESLESWKTILLSGSTRMELFPHSVSTCRKYRNL